MARKNTPTTKTDATPDESTHRPAPPAPLYLKWHRARGEDLREAIEQHGKLTDGDVVDCEALYLWKRSLRIPSHLLGDTDGFLAWLESTACAVNGRIGNRRLSHFAFLDGLSLQGAPLSGEKLDTLTRFVSKGKNRAWLASLLSEVARFTPPLYVGETCHLAERARQHICGESQFGSEILKSGTTYWDCLDLHYYAIGPPRVDEHDAKFKATRTALESLVTSLTIAGYVERRG